MFSFRRDRKSQNVLITYQQLISRDFDDDISMEAALKYPNKIEKAINFILNTQQTQHEIKKDDASTKHANTNHRNYKFTGHRGVLQPILSHDETIIDGYIKLKHKQLSLNPIYRPIHRRYSRAMEHFSPSFDDDQMSQYQLIVDGFIRMENETWRLIIPYEILTIIGDIVNNICWMEFQHYNETKFRSDKNGSMITPVSKDKIVPYYNHMIYPSPNGFTEGIHSLSVKYVEVNGDPLNIFVGSSIGVTTNINQQWIMSGIGDYNKWPCDDGDASFYWSNKWTIGSIIKVSLDVNRGVVEYFCDDKKLKEDKLKQQKKAFYFAMCINSDYRSPVFEIVSE